MKFDWKALIVSVAGVIVLLVIPLENINGVPPAKAQDPNSQGPFVSEPVTPKLSRAVRDLPTMTPRQFSSAPVINPRRLHPVGPVNGNGEADAPDPLLQNTPAQSSLRTPAVTTSFEGISFLTGGTGVPPDPNGDVGLNHYVQMVNTTFAIYNKSGSLLVGPTNINQLWNGAGGLCEANNDGDPIVLYDSIADRWLLSQFAFINPSIPPWAECIAISQTADPTGAYFLRTYAVECSKRMLSRP